MEKATESDPPSCSSVFMIGQDSRGTGSFEIKTACAAASLSDAQKHCDMCVMRPEIIHEPSSWSTEHSSSTRVGRDGRQCCIS
jgi:hypothetical protein